MRKKQGYMDLTGQRFGQLEVLSEGPGQAGKHYWNTICDCGRTRLAYTSALRFGKATACIGHYQRIADAEMVGKRFGLLVVKALDHKDDSGQRNWLTVCQCGNERIACTAALKGGHAKHCVGHGKPAKALPPLIPHQVRYPLICRPWSKSMRLAL